MSSYTLEEERLMGWPVPAPPATCCDGAGCDSDASLLVEGAALCASCGERFGIGTAAFRIPFQALTGGDAWRQARADLYREELERLHLERPIPRTVLRNQCLDSVIAQRVDTLIAAARLRDS